MIWCSDVKTESLESLSWYRCLSRRQCFFFNYGEYQSHFVGCCPFIELLVMFALGFKAKVIPCLCASFVCTQWIPQTHIWCNTCWRLDSQHCSWAFMTDILSHVYQALVGVCFPLWLHSMGLISKIITTLWKKGCIQTDKYKLVNRTGIVKRFRTIMVSFAMNWWRNDGLHGYLALFTMGMYLESGLCKYLDVPISILCQADWFVLLHCVRSFAQS